MAATGARGYTSVRRARVCVVTDHRGSGQARAALALVARGACIAVVTRHTIGQRDRHALTLDATG
jgi:hypothetical protein